MTNEHGQEDVMPVRVESSIKIIEINGEAVFGTGLKRAVVKSHNETGVDGLVEIIVPISDDESRSFTFAGGDLRAALENAMNVGG